MVGESVIKRTTPDLLGKIVLWLAQPFLLHSHSGLSHFIAVNDIYGVIYNKCSDHRCSGRSAHMLILNYDIIACFMFCYFASYSDNLLIVDDSVLSILSRLILEFKFEI